MGAKSTLAALAISALALAVPSAALADELDTDASASFASPVGIMSAAPMAFGEVVRPNIGQCTYDMSPDSNITATGGDNCAVIAGVQLAAEFTLGCEANSLLRLTLLIDDLAPSGASFSAGSQPFTIDGAGAGADTMLAPCDADGTSVVMAGGQLTVTDTAPAAFSGTVGTITLEAIYE